MLVHLPREAGYGIIPRTKNGPALAGYGTVTMANALAATITTLPEQLRSLTWDRGKELSDHARFTVTTGVYVFFADPHSPGSSEARTRTPTGCCATTSPKAPTCPVGAPRRSARSPQLSTTGRARPSAGRPPPKHSTNTYSCSNKTVLRRPVESALPLTQFGCGPRPPKSDTRLNSVSAASGGRVVPVAHRCLPDRNATRTEPAVCSRLSLGGWGSASHGEELPE